MADPRDAGGALLVIHVGPAARRPRRWPFAVQWAALWCLLGRHQEPREMQLVRGPDGRASQPPIVRWRCERCGRTLGETDLRTLGLD